MIYSPAVRDDILLIHSALYSVLDFIFMEKKISREKVLKLLEEKNISHLWEEGNELSGKRGPSSINKGKEFFNYLLHCAYEENIDEITEEDYLNKFENGLHILAFLLNKTVENFAKWAEFWVDNYQRERLISPSLEKELILQPSQGSLIFDEYDYYSTETSQQKEDRRLLNEIYEHQKEYNENH